MPAQAAHHKAPVGHATKVRIILPVGRLVRLGAAEDTVKIFQRWWDLQPDQKAAQDRLGYLTDAQIETLIEAVPAIQGAKADDVLAAVRSLPAGRQIGAELAAVIESDRNEIRSGLINKLMAVR